MADSFRSGEVVTLKSGGPGMTVEAATGQYRETYPPEPPDPLLGCVWFDGPTLRRGQFYESSLTRPTGGTHG
jgi:uncharacterized protein YodC (DUF2158 family)